VRDHVHGRLDLAFEDLGALNLKNIVRPVEAFLLRWSAVTNMSLVPATGEALPTPDKPSIAVLAFTNMSGNPEQEYFADGIADDIITELSRTRWLLVIARNSSFAYKGNAIDVKRVGRELGVRYVLEGSVRRGGERVRVNAQLIDAETGNHIWADRYDRDLADVFAVQDEITLAVTRAIGPAVDDAEQRRALRKPPESLGAWETYLRGQWHDGQLTATDHEQAKQFFQRAIVIDAKFPAPYVALARAYLDDAATFGTRSLEDAANCRQAGHAKPSPSIRRMRTRGLLSPTQHWLPVMPPRRASRSHWRGQAIQTLHWRFWWKLKFSSTRASPCRRGKASLRASVSTREGSTVLG
jgi:adenylate cyclase